MTKLKCLASFIAGVIVGVIGVLLYEILGKPVELAGTSGTGDDAENVVDGFPVFTFNPPMIMGKPVEPSEGLFDDVPHPTESEFAEHVKTVTNKIIEHKKSLDDTQPIKVERPDSGNELGFDCGEPWGKAVGPEKNCLDNIGYEVYSGEEFGVVRTKVVSSSVPTTLTEDG